MQLLEKSTVLTARRIIVAITGASGSAYGLRCLEQLAAAGVETHLIVTKAGELTMRYELGLSSADIETRAFARYAAGDVGAPIASGSFRTDGMIIAPCSVRTMSEIATGVTAGLVSRAADVVLKERRRLVLAVRETPLHLGHLRTMTALAEMGAVIAPPVPAFYAEPGSIDEMIDQTTARWLDLFDIQAPARRWGEDLVKGAR